MIVFSIVEIFILIAITPVFSATSPMSSKDSMEVNNPSFKGSNSWYWYPSYQNYAPSGMPDFDLYQNQWLTIYPGENGVIDSIPEGDDFYNPTENCIVPGPNCHMETNVYGDDITVWSFSGPAAVANCLWWFDSKYDDPTGIPGDGKDNFNLVGDYGAGDDHSTTNVPFLIEKLAREMKTNSKGQTYINDMQEAIDSWLVDTNLSNKIEVDSYEKPSFNFIANQTKVGMNVVLLLGYYNRLKQVDQSQLTWEMWTDLPFWNPGHLQSFTPVASSLDEVQLLLQGLNWSTVKVSIYNSLPETPWVTPLGESIRYINPPAYPQWFDFSFKPAITLTPGMQYYIAVKAFDDIPYSNISWCYNNFSSYPNGFSWWCFNDYVLDPKPDYDFAFKTVYKSETGIRQQGEQFVTVAGMNTEGFQISICDPSCDIENLSGFIHNDPKNVSHDIYNVSIGSPCQNLNYLWWLPGYSNSNFEFTIVEQAVIISDVEKEPPVVKITKPENGIYLMDRFIIGFFMPLILGKIMVEVNAFDNQSGIEKVEFYINDVLEETVYTAPYNWLWKGQLGIRTIKVIAYDTVGNKAEAELGVLKIF